MILNLEAKGVSRAQDIMNEMMEFCTYIGNTIKSVDLHGKKRGTVQGRNVKGQWTGGIGKGTTNDQVAEWLKDGGRDFFHADQHTANDVAAAIAGEMQKRLDTVARLKLLAMKQAGGTFKKMGAQAKKKAREIAAAGLIKGMQKYMQEVVANIQYENWEGDGDHMLNEDYEKWKKQSFGFAYPIGKASGQLLANLDSSEKSDIKLRKG